MPAPAILDDLLYERLKVLAIRKLREFSIDRESSQFLF
jgi:hypothetical protein